jgi:hypothetical protein
MYYQFLYLTETKLDEYYKNHPNLKFPDTESLEDDWEWIEYIAEGNNIDEAIEDFKKHGEPDIFDLDHEVEIVADENGTETKEREMIDISDKDFYYC